MQIINYLILVLPYILILFVMYLIYNSITRKQNFKKLGISVITPILIMSIVLVVYYWPVSNILVGDNIEYINIFVKDKNVEIRDKAKMNKILEIVNKYKFTKSASGSIIQKSFAADYHITITTFDYKKNKIINLCVLSDLMTKDAPPTVTHSPEENGLYINEQMYKSSDNNGLSRNFYNLIKEFGVLDK